MNPIIALGTGLLLTQPGRGEVATPLVHVRCSAISNDQTPLPDGLRPLALLENRTGVFLIGDHVFGLRSDVERATRASLDFIKGVAAALPISDDDERAVDALMTKRASALTTRPLRRREGSSR